MRKKRNPEQYREAFRRFARKVVDISDPVFLASERARARDGKMSPQEKARYIDAAFYFDQDVKPAPPPVTIQILQQFADGTADKLALAVVGEQK